MIEAIKYIDPTWYYNIKPNDDAKCDLLDYKNLSELEKSFIEYDSNYEKLSQADASFQALKKGVISTDGIALNKSYFQDIPVSDHYRFLRKYFHLGWVVYFLVNRILQLHNPAKEIGCFIKSLKVRRYSLYENVVQHNLDSVVLKDTFKVSVILPTLNRYKHLANILKDLSSQSIPPYEIIIIDQSQPGDANFYDSFQYLPIKVIQQEKRGQWYARNEAIKVSLGEYLLFVDDDSRVSDDWIEQHLKCILFFGCDISAGVTIDEDKVLHKEKKYYHYAEEFDSGNALVKRNIFTKVGLFDNKYNGLRRGDTEFGLRSYLNGFISISNPKAIRYHIKSTTGGMRDWGSINSFKPMSFWGPRPDLGTLYLFHKYFNKKYLLPYLLVRIYLSYIPSKLNANWLGKIIAGVNFFIFSPYWVFNLIVNLLSVKKYRSQIQYIN